MTAQDLVCLVIPCYNEFHRLKPELFKAAPEYIRFVFVDDGSSDETSALLKSHFDHVLIHPTNQGKAQAVRTGIQYALSSNSFEDCEWFGYWDADLATPLEEVFTLLSGGKAFGRLPAAIIGSRVFRLGASIERSFQRHILGRLFATASALLLDLKTYDSQCGAKLFQRAAAAVAFKSPFISRWLFDIEILSRLKGSAIVEIPLARWKDIKGSKLNIIPEIFRTLRDLLKIAQAYRAYDAKAAPALSPKD